MPPRRRPQVSLEDGMRNGTHFLHGPDGYSYHFNKVMKGGRISMECMGYRKTCRGRASVNSEGMEFRQTQHHNHDPDWCLIHERRLRSAILTRCRNGDQENFRTMYDQERVKLRIPRLAAVNLPFSLLQPSMQRAREKSLPGLPHSLSELDVILRDPKYKFVTKTLDGLDNIYAGATGTTRKGTRCLVFISNRMRRYLRRVKHLFSDATFCIVPRNLGCAQVWNLVTMRDGHHVIAIGSILMQSKTVKCYRTAIGALKRIAPGFTPDTIMCDFEAAQQKAFALEFPLVDRDGCLFHAAKAILQHGREMGLVTIIKEDEVCDTILRSICAISLLPSNKIVPGVLSLGSYTESMGRWGVLGSFFDYIRDTWLRPSRLPILSVSKSVDRTSNCCESYNRVLQKAVGELPHPNAFFLISGFVRLEDRYFQDLVTLKHGGKIGFSRKLSAVANDERIKGLTREVEGNHIGLRAFLRRASRRMQNVYNDVLGLITKAYMLLYSAIMLSCVLVSRDILSRFWLST